jgi:hypothetical protein
VWKTATGGSVSSLRASPRGRSASGHTRIIATPQCVWRNKVR